jgi:hypothetical protein
MNERKKLEEALYVYVRSMSGMYPDTNEGVARVKYFDELDKYIDNKISIAIWRFTERYDIKASGSK